MKNTVLICVLAALPTLVSAQGQEMISCSNQDGNSIVLELWSPSSFGENLHCLNADFMAGAEICSPDGGWGLNGDDDWQTLVSVTNEWKAAYKHRSSKVTAISGPKAVIFNAQLGEGLGNNLSYAWKFRLDRRNSSGTWYTGDGLQITYSCDVQN